ncbi:hypothetical protein PG984_008485 [Apiospora sp. TS-2023a]
MPMALLQLPKKLLLVSTPEDAAGNEVAAAAPVRGILKRMVVFVIDDVYMAEARNALGQHIEELDEELGKAKTAHREIMEIQDTQTAYKKTSREDVESEFTQLGNQISTNDKNTKTRVDEMRRLLDSVIESHNAGAWDGEEEK